MWGASKKSNDYPTTKRAELQKEAQPCLCSLKSDRYSLLCAATRTAIVITVIGSGLKGKVSILLAAHGTVQSRNRQVSHLLRAGNVQSRSDRQCHVDRIAARRGHDR